MTADRRRVERGGGHRDRAFPFGTLGAVEPVDGTAHPPEYRDPRASSDRAASYIRRLIWEGTIAPGSRLNQDEIANALGASRTPVREAIIALEREGALRMVPNRGVFAVELSSSDVEDHFELRGLVMGFAMQRCSERADGRTRAELRALDTRLAGEHSSKEMEALVFELYGIVNDVGGSPRLQALSRVLTGLVHGNYFDEVPGSLAVEREHLARLLPLMIEGDADAVFAGYRHMQRDHCKLALEVMLKRGTVRPE